MSALSEAETFPARRERRLLRRWPDNDDVEAVEATTELLNRVKNLHRDILLRNQIKVDLPSEIGTEHDPALFSQPPPGPSQFHIPSSDHRYPLLGESVRVPFGIPSSVLSSSAQWIEYFFDAGYNVITTQSMRSSRSPGYDPPNFVMTTDRPTRHGRRERLVAPKVGDGVRFGGAEASSINSYGIPSDPDEWLPQIEKLAARERDGQLLIVSVVGCGEKSEDIVRDFVDIATRAADAGARVIEANLSFLRKSSVLPYAPYCRNPRLTVRIMSALAEALYVKYDVELVAKLSYMPRRRLSLVATALAPIVSGISGINAVPIRVVDESGQSYFPKRPTPPMMAGANIRSQGLDFVRTVAAVRARSASRFDIIGMGGVSSLADAVAMRAAGADAVLASTGVTNNLFLGWEVAQGEEALRATPLG